MNQYPIQFHIAYNFAEICSIWNNYAPKDIFWQENFYNVIEEEKPSGIQSIYCIVKREEKVIGIIYGQHKLVKLAESIRLKSDQWMSNLVKKILLPRLKQDTLIIGNLLLTGNYGMYFPDITPKESFEILELAIKEITKDLKNKKKINIGPVLIKDFFTHEVESVTSILGATKFKVQPNMIMNVDRDWSSSADYVKAFKAKARTRYNKAREKSVNIECREMSLSDLDSAKQAMNILYMNIATNASFNMFYLNPSYFYSLKAKLGDSIKLYGYYDQGQLKGFITMIENGSHLDAHFLGYDPASNHEAQLYLNMLFDMVGQSIDMNKEKLILSRTAMEIKSSVGAKPYDMYCFLLHLNPLLNRITPPIIDFLYKDIIWEERNPFK